MASATKILNWFGTIIVILGFLLTAAGIIYVGVTEKIDSIFWGLSISGLALLLIGVLLVIIGHVGHFGKHKKIVVPKENAIHIENYAKESGGNVVYE